jgi:PAS domain S-box-containing protein
MDLSEVTGKLGQHVRDAVVITEAESVDSPGPRMVWVNQAFTDMTGYSLEEAIGQTPRMLQGPDTDPETRVRIRNRLKAWRPVREVLKNYTKDGKPFWVELDIKPIADSTGWYHYWVAVQRDVTAHVEREQALVKAREEAESANRMKSEFLANMSHEIRTPLNGVLGMAQVLRLTDLNPRQRRAVETIVNSGQSLLGLIEDILDLSTIEAGRLTLEPQPIRSRALMDAAADAVRGVALDKGLEVRIKPGADSDIEFLTDPRRMRQVLINLAGNAAKFTETGEIVIACRRKGDAMVFEVRDTGPGVPEAMREVIFNRFQQGDGSNTRSHGGAGLGLAIVKKLVDAAGGQITVTDAPEGGACFRVSLPFKPVRSPCAGPGGPCAMRADADKCARRALLVDDNPLNRDVVVEALGLAGWRVDCAASAEPGLRAWRKGGYDLVVMDRQMPGMSGEEAVAVLRAEEADHAPARRTPVLMLTAHAMADAEKSAIQAGADAYMSKPFELPQLIALADELAQHAALRPEDRAGSGVVTRRSASIQP